MTSYPLSLFKTGIGINMQHCQESLTFLAGYLRATQADDRYLPQKAEEMIKTLAFDCITGLQLHGLQNKLHHIDFANPFQIRYTSNKPAT